MSTFETGWPNSADPWLRLLRLSVQGSAECVDLIEKLLVREPKERLALEKVLWHPFLVKEVVGGDDGQLPEPIAPSEAQPKKGSLAKPLAESDPRPSRLSPLKKKATLVPRRPSKIKPSAKRKVCPCSSSRKPFLPTHQSSSQHDAPHAPHLTFTSFRFLWWVLAHKVPTDCACPHTRRFAATLLAAAPPLTALPFRPPRC